MRRRLEADAARFETHVVVTADHGESFGEGGAIGHGRRVSDEQVRVPLLVVSPRVEPGVRRKPVGSIDVGATLLDLAGLGARLGRGRSLLEPRAEASPVVGMRRTFGEGAMETLADGSMRPLPTYRFFAVVEGAVYRGNSAALGPPRDGSHPDAVRKSLRSLFAEFERELAARSVTPVDDAEARAAPEALGYVE